MSEKSNSVIEVIKKPVGELITEAADLGLDEIMDRLVEDADSFKDIPIIKWIFLGHKITSNIHLSFFVKKYAAFIGPIKECIPEAFWDDENIKELVESDKKFKTLIDETIVALDRYQAINKAKLLGLLFVKTFKDHLFTIEEYNTLLFSIELMHPYLGVPCLKQFYDYKAAMQASPDEQARNDIWHKGCLIDFSPLSSTCLISLPIGGTYSGDWGGAFINALGEKFYREVVSVVTD